MSGTQYSIDYGLINELNGNCRPVAFDLSFNTSLKKLFQFKYTKQDTLQNKPFSELELNDRFLVVNALIVYRLSCIDHVYFFEERHIDFVVNEYIRAYEDTFSIRERHYLDFEEEILNYYPAAQKWFNLIQSQAKINHRFWDVAKAISK